MPDRVLIFIDWYLPGYKAGGPVTSCANMINALRNEIEFFVVTRNSDYCEESPYDDIPPNQWVERGKNEKVMYLSADNLSYRTIRQIIRNTDSDVIYVNGLYSRVFSIYPLLALRNQSHRQKKVVVAVRGMLSRSAIGIKPFKKSLFLKVARALGLYRNITFHATNSKEKEDVLREIGSNAKVIVASNISKGLSDNIEPIKKEVNTIKLLNIARISPEKNLLYLLKILKDLPVLNVSLSIYGSVYNAEYWNDCQQAINELPTHVQVKYCGQALPEEIPQIIQVHHVLVLPSKGENFGHVVAESLMNGRPVVISDQTPWRNLESSHAGFDLPLENPEKFIDAISRLAQMDESAYKNWTDGASKKGSQIAADDEPRKQHLKMFGKQQETNRVFSEEKTS